MATPLTGLINGADFSHVADYADGQKSALAQFSDSFRTMVSMKSEYMKYISTSGLMVDSDTMTFLFEICVMQSESIHPHIKHKRHDHALRFFLEFVLPAPERLGNSPDVNESKKMVLSNLAKFYYPTGTKDATRNDKWYRSPPKAPEDDDGTDGAKGGPSVPAGVPDNRHQSYKDADAAVAFLKQSAHAATVNWADFAKNIKILIACWKLTKPEERNKNFLQRAFEVIICISKMGTVLDDKLTNLIEQINEETRVHLSVTPDDIKAIWRFIAEAAARSTITIPMALKSLFNIIRPEESLRVSLTLKQSAYVGVAGVMIVADAMRILPDSPAWVWAQRNLQTELNTFYDAARNVATNSFIAFQDQVQTEKVKSTRFPNLFYLAKMLLIKIAGQRSLQNLKTGGALTRRKVIDGLITKIGDQAEADIDLTGLNFADGQSALTLTGDMGFILQSLASSL